MGCQICLLNRLLWQLAQVLLGPAGTHVQCTFQNRSDWLVIVIQIVYSLLHLFGKFVAFPSKGKDVVQSLQWDLCYRGLCFPWQSNAGYYNCRAQARGQLGSRQQRFSCKSHRWEKVGFSDVKARPRLESGDLGITHVHTTSCRIAQCIRAVG